MPRKSKRVRKIAKKSARKAKEAGQFLLTVAENYKTPAARAAVS